MGLLNRLFRLKRRYTEDDEFDFVTYTFNTKDNTVSIEQGGEKIVSRNGGPYRKEVQCKVMDREKLLPEK